VPTAPKLASLTDVAVTGATIGNLLTSDGAGRWAAQPPAAYTKAEVDTRINAVVSGLEHGVSVQAIANSPPATPVADEIYIVGTAPTGAWVGNANSLALWGGTAWTFTPPQAKESHLVEDQEAVYAWNSTTRIWAKVAQGTTASTGDGMPVGAIVMWPVGSIPANYLELNGARFDAVAYPDLYRTLNTDILPDFRDRYVRGALAGHAALTTQDWTTGRPRTAFTGTTSNAGSHSHTGSYTGPRYGANSGNDVNPANPGGSGNDNYNGHLNIDANGDHTHTVSINGGGDAFTAPVHFSMNTFIKIN
jgi:hypothetical protein